MSEVGSEGAEGFDVEGGEGDGYTETEHENLGDRLRGACAGICVGLLLFVGPFPLLFWNEGRAVERYDALDEAETRTSSIDPASVDPAYEGRLVHFSANVTNGGDALVDPVFGIESGGLALRRDAEMYQWIERVRTTTKKTLDGGKTPTKTYTYEKKWKDLLVDSRGFQQPVDHANPSRMEFEPAALRADPMLIGRHKLPRELAAKIKGIDWEEPMGVGVDDVADPVVRGRAAGTPDGLYFGSSEWDPKVGDSRVSFKETPASVATVVGVQDGDTLAETKGDGGGVLLFRRGNHSVASMFDEAESENEALTWGLRLLGFVLMASGLYLIFRPVEVFADIVPFAGSIVGCGIIFVSVLISAILSTITISISWLVARPKIGGIILAVTLTLVGCCAFGAKILGERKWKDVDDDGLSSSPSSRGVVADSLPTAFAISEGKVVPVPLPVPVPVPVPDTTDPTAYSTPGPYNPEVAS